MWHFDRPARLAALARRAGGLAGHLAREALDAPRGSAERRAYLARLATATARLDRLRLLAKVARWNDRGAA